MIEAPAQPLLQWPSLAIRFFLGCAEIVAAGEVLTRAKKCDDMNVAVGTRNRERVVEFFEQSTALGIADLRSVGGNSRYVRHDYIFEKLIVHA
jgi:hypothetical protein